MDTQNFILIGNTSLVEFAVDTLQKLGHKVEALLTTTDSVRRYSAEHAIDSIFDLSHAIDRLDQLTNAQVLVLDLPVAFKSLLERSIITTEVYCLNPLISELSPTITLSAKFLNSLGFIWKASLPSQAYQFDTVAIDFDDYEDREAFFNDVLCQLAVKIARHEIESPQTRPNKFSTASELTVLPIAKSPYHSIVELTAICAAFTARYFNHQEITILSPLSGLDSLLFDCTPGVMQVVTRTCAMQNMTAASLQNQTDNFLTKRLPPQDNWYFGDGLHISIPILATKLPDIDDLSHVHSLLTVHDNKDNILRLQLVFDEQAKADYDIKQIKIGFLALLQRFLASPNAILDSLKPLPALEERKFLAHYCLSGLKPVLTCDNLYTAFADSAARHAEKIALRHQDKVLTYKELYAKVNAVAKYLSLRKIKSDFIGIYFHKNFEFIIALLAVLKAGYAYLPLDPKLPKDRLKALIDLSGVDTVLTSSDCLGSLPEGESVQVLTIEKLPDLSDATIHFRKHQEVAYLIYTSGSTGSPKGVLGTHRGALNMIQCTSETYPVTEEDRLLLLASCGFDISVWEVFCPLLAGGQIVLPEEDVYSDPRKLVHDITRYGVTLLHVVPSVLSYLVRYLEKGLCTTLKCVVSGGEALTLETAQAFKDRLPECQLYHGYGPTEAAITALHHLVEAKDFAHKRLPIGLPLERVDILIVNDQHQLVPIGVPGELLIGGIGLAVGYLNDSDKTAESFISVAVDSATGIVRRFYKTGDIVKRRQDGLIEYLGRRDHQIKIYGNRVELEEIERTIKQCADIEEAVVVAKRDQYTVTLLAFLQLKFTGQLQVQNEAIQDRVKQALKSSLPSYMQPGQIIFIDQVPKLSNEKIDRKKLISMADHALLIVKRPENLVEAKLLNYLSALTGLEQIPIDKHFFELGFSSLVTTQLAAFLDDEFGVRLTPYELANLGSLERTAQFIQSNTTRRGDTASNRIHRVSRYVSLPLSHAQQRLWFVHQVENQQSHAYNMVNAYRIAGPLDISLLQEAIQQLTDRHESLRTLFKSSLGKPHQVIIPRVPNLFEEVLLPEGRLSEAIQSFCAHEFKLDKEVAVKFGLFHVQNKNDYVFIILQHNIITDGWSAGILIRDLSALYKALLTQQPCVLPALSIQYADFAVWQNHQIASDCFKDQLLYWTNRLKNYQALDLPLTYPRKTRQTFKGNTKALTIKGKVLSSIAHFVQNARITLYTYLMSALNLTLYSYCDQDDIVVGTAAANRGQVQVKDIMGFFVNIFPIRSDLSGNPTISQLIDRTHQSCLEAISNQDIPFDILVDHLGIEREPNRSPVFQLLFLMQDAADNTVLELAGCSVEAITVALDTAIYDMTFNVFNQVDRLSIHCQYNSELFSEVFVDDFLEHYQQAIEAIYHSGQVHIDDYNSLTPHDHRVIAECNAASQYPITQSFLSLFSKSVAHYPDDSALIEPANILTYRELDRTTQAIARLLAKLKLRRKVLIGVFLPKSVAYVSAMIAVMKSGHAYVPLEPSLPPIRVSHILQQANINTLIVQCRAHLPVEIQHAVQNIIELQTVEIAKEEADIQPDCTGASLDELAYAIFTSGSTGMPKGVKITHRNLSNVLLYFKDTLLCQGPLKLLSLTTPTFDIFQLECLLPLIRGGSCYLFDSKADSYSEQVHDIIAQYQPTHIQATPSTWQLILNRLADARLSITAITGGEALEPSLLARMQRHVSQVLNVYGPTETTIWSCLADLTHSTSVHIGKPIANTRCYVANSKYRVLPVGCKGQLLIAGDGVGQGYFDKQQTNQSFVNHSLGVSNDKQRFYHTGDEVVLQQDGTLKYLGRTDEQVKIRGYRIELTEITAVIKQNAFIQEAVTMAFIKEALSRYETILIAFICIDPKADLPQVLIQLTKQCAEQLPRYMLPSVFVPIEAIPLSISGKVDKFALKTLYRDYLSAAKTIKTLTSTEAMVANIWKETLKLEAVDIDKTFYNLGGHSLLIPVMVANLMQTMNCAITIREFIQHPTVQELARYLDEKREATLARVA